MPTVQQWIDGIKRKHSARIISSDNLLAEVRNKQLAKNIKLMGDGKSLVPTKTRITTIAQFDPEKTVAISPIALLHSVGRITTPTIPNLADLSYTWAAIRYFWAFDSSLPGGPLVLSDIARNLDYHQKCLLSDQIGMGMAHYLMANYFGAPNARDISAALNENWDMVQHSRAMPDYLFFDNPASHLYVVECKGTQSSYNSALDQLRRGTEQIPSITFSNGRMSTGLIVATCMLNDRTEIYVVDPPGEESGDYTSKFDKNSNSERIGPSTWRIKDQRKFETNARLFSRAKLLNFAGAEREALLQLPPEVQKRWEKSVQGIAPQAPLRTEEGEFIGTKGRITTTDGLTIEIYRGLLKELKDNISVPPPVSVDRESYGAEEKTAPKVYLDRFPEHGFLEKIEDSPTGILARSICRDGTVFQLTISA